MSKQYLDYEGLKEYDNLIKQYVADHARSAAEPYDDSAIVDDLNALKALVGDTTVADQINAAIASLVNGAPNSLDTLKEIADWINTHGESASDLVGVVAEQGQQITELNSKVDAISAISGTYIEALFLTPVTVQDGQTVQDAITALGEGEKLVLTAPVTEDLTINKDAVIEADGVVFSGTITVDKAAAVTVIGAEFTGQVVVA
jgi:hypothetical protein